MTAAIQHATLDPQDALVTAGQWQAGLELRFEQRARGCRLVRNSHYGPLYVQKAFYPEGKELAHVYLLHPPGGLVSGDNLRIALDLERGAQVLLTTPGAGRVYRARPDRRLQQQTQVMNLDAGASLEWFPQETIVYPDANASLQTQINLETDSRFLGWEITCLGLPANQVRFDRGTLRQRLVITREQRPVLIENLLLREGSRNLYSGAAGLQNCPINGIFVAGPIEADAELEALINSMRAVTANTLPGSVAGISHVNGFLVARYLGNCSEQAKKLFIELWELARPLLNGRPAKHPRIWST